LKLEAKEPFMLCFNEPWGIKFHSVLTLPKKQLTSTEEFLVGKNRRRFLFEEHFFTSIRFIAEGEIDLNAFFSVTHTTDVDCSSADRMKKRLKQVLQFPDRMKRVY
jgi:hypothetical protein